VLLIETLEAIMEERGVKVDHSTLKIDGLSTTRLPWLWQLSKIRASSNTK
jgi:hypothetical protein